MNLQINTKLNDVIHDLNHSGSLDELFKTFLKGIRLFGYDYATYGTVSKNKKKIHAEFFLNNYPPEWIDIYTKKYRDIDPVCEYGFQTFKPFYWKDLPQNMKLSEKQKRVLTHAEEFGLHHGIGISFPTGDKDCVSGVGIASKNFALKSSDLYPLHFLTTHFNFLYTSSLYQTNTYKLTSREKEILTWSSYGKSNWEISKILNISTHTVDFHLRKIYQKLNVNNKLSATVIAVKNKLLF